MADIITDFLNANLGGIPLWFILIAIIIGLYFIYLRAKPKEEKLKRLSLYKEVRNNLEELFALSEHNLGYGKPLKSGFVNLGFIIKAITINWSDKIGIVDNLRKDINIEKYKELKEILEKNKEKTDYKTIYCFKICGKGRISQIFANIFNRDVRYLLADSDIVSILPTEIQINPNSQPTSFIGIYIYSKAGREILEDIAFKISRIQELEEIINFLPKQTFLEVNQSKTIEQIKQISDIQNKKRKQMLEQLMED